MGLGLGCVLAIWFLVGCVSERITDRIDKWEGPQLNVGRMSATLGVTLLGGDLVKGGAQDDVFVAVIGGSPIEVPFEPVMGKFAVEVANMRCLLNAMPNRDCMNFWRGNLTAQTQAIARNPELADCQCWQSGGLDIQHQIAGRLFPLPDGRFFAWSSIYVFDAESSRLESTPPEDNPKAPISGAVAAVILDFVRGMVTPIYRPINNQAGAAPLKKGDNLALTQRAFASDLQLRDGRIVRIGGKARYISPNPKIECIDQTCHYCNGTKCTSGAIKFFCDETTKHQCPVSKGEVKNIVFNDIEIYTPPPAGSPPNHLGFVTRIKMDTERAELGSIELDNGTVLITGGRGASGDGTKQGYRSTYYLQPNPPGAETLTAGPSSLFYRKDHAMARLKDGRILITGGTDQEDVTLKTSEIYEPKLGIFLPAPSMILPREDQEPINIGDLILFAGGEDSGTADLIRNSAEVFNAHTGTYLGLYFLFNPMAIKYTETHSADKVAGISDFITISLNPNTSMLLAGQQGQEDDDGEFISNGRGSKRTLILQYSKGLSGTQK
jgi:hypothetical protein